MSHEEQRAIASLKTVPGFKLLIDEVVKLSRDGALGKLKLATGQEAVYEAAITLRVWDEVVRMLETVPGEYVEALKREGDEIYG